MRFLTSALLFPVAVLLLSGCAANKRAQLEDEINNYILALKRDDKMAALSFVQAENKKEFFSKSQKLDKIQISNIKIEGIFPNENLDEALVTLSLEYFRPTSMNLSTSKRLYTWNYNKEAKAWLLKGSQPFGRTQ